MTPTRATRPDGFDYDSYINSGALEYAIGPK